MPPRVQTITDGTQTPSRGWSRVATSVCASSRSSPLKWTRCCHVSYGTWRKHLAHGPPPFKVGRAHDCSYQQQQSATPHWMQATCAAHKACVASIARALPRQDIEPLHCMWMSTIMISIVPTTTLDEETSGGDGTIRPPTPLRKTTGRATPGPSPTH